MVGLLIDNFGALLHTQNYNPPYYRRLLETYGFQLSLQPVHLLPQGSRPAHPGVSEKVSVLLNDSIFSFEHLRVKNLTKFAKDFR